MITRMSGIYTLKRLHKCTRYIKMLQFFSTISIDVFLSYLLVYNIINV